MKPLGKRILVEVIPPNQSSFIVIPQIVDNITKVHRGRVISLGSKVSPEIVKEGDIVVYEGIYGASTNREDTQRVLDVGCLLAIETKE